jgi:hypothetical protein
MTTVESTVVFWMERKLARINLDCETPDSYERASHTLYSAYDIETGSSNGKQNPGFKDSINAKSHSKSSEHNDGMAELLNKSKSSG